MLAKRHGNNGGETPAVIDPQIGGDRGNSTIDALASSEFGDQTVYVVAVEGDMDIAEKKANLWDSFKEVDENDTDAVAVFLILFDSHHISWLLIFLRVLINILKEEKFLGR